MGFGRHVVWAGMLVLLAGATGGCGSGDGAGGCPEQGCEFGVCDRDRGACLNPESCAVDRECLPGWECRDRRCRAVTSCESDGDCETGVCGGEGVCVNPEACASDEECLPRTYCDIEAGSEEGSCVADPCNEVGCERGVCERGSGECVSAESCTRHTESVDCLAGEQCAVPGDGREGTCQGPETFCERYACGDDGVCRFEAGGCTDASECEDDGECLAGNFCDEAGECRPDICEQGGVECGDDGVCQPASGECENAESCESSDECVDEPSHLCIDGTCRLESTACGDAGGDGGCPGRQICEYAAGELTAECVEPETCETSLDCRGGRRCGGRSCMEAQSCGGDGFEPNDGKEKATDLGEAAPGQRLSASVCPGDVDVYETTPAELHNGGEGDRLVVELGVPVRDRGLGPLAVEVLGSDGELLGRASTDGDEAGGRAELEVPLDASREEVHRLEVAAADGEVQAGGVRYELAVGVVSETNLEACERATEIAIGETLEGETPAIDSPAFDASCMDDATPSQTVYRFELEVPREVTFELSPRSDRADLGMSLRSRCAQIGSERGCADGRRRGTTETLTATLESGTHYLIVESLGGPGAVGAEFELTSSHVRLVCHPGRSYCDADGAMHRCEPRGGRYVEVDCEHGCDVARGRCRRPTGDRCGGAPRIDSDTEMPQVAPLDEARDDYRVEPGACLGGGQTHTGGPDAAYRLEVPGETVVWAEVTFGAEANGSAYLVDDCQAPGESCRLGANDSTGEPHRERLTLENRDEAAEEVYLIVDLTEGEPAREAQIEVEYRGIICSPGTVRCDGWGDTEVCGEFGVEWKRHGECPFGCADGTCIADTCSTAIEIPDDGSEFTREFNPGDMSEQYEILDAACLPYDDGSPGSEAVFQVQLDAGEILEVSWQHEDASLYVVRDCANLKSSCVAAEQTAGTAPQQITYRADSTGTHYVVADVDYFQTPVGGTTYREGTLTAEVRQPTCSPRTTLGCTSGGNAVEYCTETGLSTSFSCPTSCSGGQCGTPTGQVCTDAIPIDDGEVDVRDFGGIPSQAFISGSYGDCTFTNPDTPQGADRIYRIELQAGEELSVDWKSGIDENKTSGGGMYLLGRCGEMGSCKTNGGTYEADGVADALTYTASEDETVFLYVGHTTSIAASDYDYRIDVGID